MILKVGIGIAALWLLFGRKRKAFASSTTATTIIADTDTVTWSVPLGKNVEQPSKDGQSIGSVRVTGTHAASKEWLADLQSDRPRTRLEIAVGAGETTEAFIFVHDAVAAECGQAEYSAWINRIEGGGDKAAPLAPGALAEFDRIMAGYGSDASNAAHVAAGETFFYYVDADNAKGWTVKSALTEMPLNGYPYIGWRAYPPEPETLVGKADWARAGKFFYHGGKAAVLIFTGQGDKAGPELQASYNELSKDSDGKAILLASGVTKAAFDRYSACIAKGGSDGACSLEATGSTGVSIAGVISGKASA